MIITSEHDFSSVNTYIHLGYASAQNWNVATHEMTWPVSFEEWGWVGEVVLPVITGLWGHLWCLLDFFIQNITSGTTVCISQLNVSLWNNFQNYCQCFYNHFCLFIPSFSTLVSYLTAFLTNCCIMFFSMRNWESYCFHKFCKEHNHLLEEIQVIIFSLFSTWFYKW